MNTIDFNDVVFRRFVGTALLFFAIPFALVWAWVIEEPMAYFDNNYPVMLAKSTLAREVVTDNVTILGDSLPQVALIPRRLGHGVVNLAWAGRSTIEALHFARIETNSPSPPKAVIVSFCPNHLTEPDLFWSYSVGFGLMSFQEVEEVRHRSWILKDPSIFDCQTPFDVDTRLKSLLYAIKFPPYYFAYLVDARVFGRYAENKQVFDHVLAERGQAYGSLGDLPTDLDRESAMRSFIPSKILDDYFNQTLALFQSRNIPVYFISIPHNEVSVRVYSPELKRGFTEYLTGYERRYPNFHVLGDVFPSYPSTYLVDSTHLNPKGAALFSDHVAKLLNDAHVPGGPFGNN